MKNKEKKSEENNLLTNSMDVNNREYKELQLLLLEKARSLSDDQKLGIELFSLQIKIEEYLKSEGEEKISVGDFLRLYIDRLNLKQNKLAQYIGINPTNFNKILSGSRKVNFELSFVLSQLFNLDPKIWMLIQVKNDYVSLKKEKGSYYKKYKLKDLIRA